jgi:hypothetical protein
MEKEKILKQDGTIKINGEEIEALSLETKKIEPMPKEALAKEKEKLNNNPIYKANGVIVVDEKNHVEKKDYLFWKILSIILIVLIAISVIWANISFNKISNKEFQQQINNTVNIAPTEVSVPINNSFTINNQNNVTINIDKAFLQGIINLLNNSNHS